jgi:hypothetical protein
VAARFWFALSELSVYFGLKRRLEASLKAESLYRDLGDRYWLFRTLRSRVMTFSNMRDRARAEAALFEIEKLFEPNWPSWHREFVQHSLGHYRFFALHEPEQARAHLAAVIERAQSAQGKSWIAEMSELYLIWVDCALGNWEVAHRRGREILSDFTLGLSFRTYVPVFIGCALVGLGRLDEAEAAIRDGLARARRATGSASWGISTVAFLAARQGRLEDAARLIGYLDATASRSAIPVTPGEKRPYDETLTLVAPALGAAELERLRIEGRELTEEQAIALVLPATETSR